MRQEIDAFAKELGPDVHESVYKSSKKKTRVDTISSGGIMRIRISSVNWRARSSSTPLSISINTLSRQKLH
jgi:hypothetical protein